MPNRTLSETIADLRKEGYTEDFNLQQHCLVCRQGEFQVFANEFVIDRAFRFDDNTDPDDEAILYAVHSDMYGLKGVLVNGYGVYSEPLTDEMANKLAFTPGADMRAED
jgi:hypothetical protein